jgi:hypothetical protein
MQAMTAAIVATPKTKHAAAATSMAFAQVPVDYSYSVVFGQALL